MWVLRHRLAIETLCQPTSPMKCCLLAYVSGILNESGRCAIKIGALLGLTEENEAKHYLVLLSRIFKGSKILEKRKGEGVEGSSKNLSGPLLMQAGLDGIWQARKRPGKSWKRTSCLLRVLRSFQLMHHL